jgi:hypothetical protein
MAVYAGPDIVENGLVLHLDAANPRSYPGTGTGWVDLKNTNTAILTGGIAYSNLNSGILSFDGSDDYGIINTSVPIESVCTICSFFKLNGSNSDTSIYGAFANGSDNWFGINSNRLFLFFTESTDVNNDNLVGSTFLDTSNSIWYYGCCTINGSTTRLYLNGVEDGNKVVAFTIGSWSGLANLGRRGNVSQRYFLGSLGLVSAYNRELSPQEIQQNFNALRGRFNL